MRNECDEIFGKGLPSDVADGDPQGPISRYARRDAGASWSPIVGESRESPSSFSTYDHHYSGSSTPAPNAACAKVTPIFTLPGEGTGASEIRYAMRLTHEVTDFAFPASVAAAPPADRPIPATAKTTLHLEYQRPVTNPDGTIDPTMYETLPGDAQEWPLEVTCEAPFTVTPRWESRATAPDGGESFCRPSTREPSQGVECLTFRFDYVGDRCAFVARHATMKLPSGDAVKLSFAGHFDRADATSTGYSLVVTNVEFE